MKNFSKLKVDNYTQSCNLIQMLAKKNEFEEPELEKLYDLTRNKIHI